ncbi:ABC transporter permease subunit [Chlorogloeopsis sp. ULAP01]|uniref:PhnE/PtxC family ABC transporter permease n=1 Tax=Chlorogloeopsis sp. ULAP01 TaxID=3056483 RepID=UPI0025AB2881|nr:ABC transporter permease subunit [Chlorogloeopsis sp. ULAP01]MDM9381222.1 ABC transporter permease subunit [Chlorogloeopsis sp. ULAP01]
MNHRGAENTEQEVERQAFFPSPYLLGVLVLLVLIIWSLQVAGIFQGDLINEGGWSLVVSFLIAVLSPEISSDFLLLTLDATLKTLAYAICGTFFSIVIGFVVGVLSSQVWWKSLGKAYKIPWLMIRAILAIPRAIHELIWGLFFINIFGLDPLVAVLAIAIPFGAITAKVFSEILDETPREPLLALLNSGVPPVSAFIYTLIPQALPNLISYSFYRLECSIRSAAVLGIIGAGGLGYQIFLSLQSLQYEQVWTLMFALLFLSGCTDFVSRLLRQRSELPNRSPTLSLLCAFFLLIFSFWYIKADFGKFWEPRTAERLTRVIQDAFPPQLIDLHQLFTLSAQTLAMSILAMAGAGLGGILLSFGAAREIVAKKRRFSIENLQSQIRIGITRLLLLIARAVPEPIWALIFLFVFFPGILPGAIALAVHNFGILGRLMAEVVENLDRRPLLSLKALGGSNSQVFIYGVLPATFPQFIAYILYRWEVCIRATVIVGLVGAGGLGRLLTEQLSSFDYKGLLTTLTVLIILTLMIDIISTTLRGTLR